MPSIEIKYFASFREKAGCVSEMLEGEFSTYSELYEHVSKKYGFNLPSSMIQVAVDDEFASLTQSLIPGAKVVFIPPVAGG